MPKAMPEGSAHPSGFFVQGQGRPVKRKGTLTGLEMTRLWGQNRLAEKTPLPPWPF